MYQITDPQELDKVFCGSDKIVLYVGFDPTAKSLHVGHLLWIRLIQKLQTWGVRPIIVAGGATSKIGDPTWKDKERVMLDYATVIDNMNSIIAKLKQLINFEDGDNPAILVNNDDWLSKLNYMEFLRNYGPLFSVNKMLSMDSVSTRLERKQHLSFLEFNYMLLQAYDFLHLFENYDCKIQLGGADQWSNMIAGTDLIRRKTGKIAIGMSMPLLTNANGKKMGKTEKGAVWMDENLCSPFEFWQYWRNVDDRDVVKLMKLFSDIDVDEIEKYETLIGKKEMNEIKIVLADTLTKLVHPKADLSIINNSAKGLFSEDSFDPESIETFELEKGINICKALVLSNLSNSLTAAKRLIDGNGVKFNKQAVNSYEKTIDHDGILSVGKKKFVKIKSI